MRRKDREITDINEIQDIFAKALVCRVSFSYNDTTYIVPMNFGYVLNDRNELYFHCAREGKKIDYLKKNNYVCFEIDTDHELVIGSDACDYSMKYRSVIGWGYINIIDDDDQKIIGLNHILSRYSSDTRFSYQKSNLDRILVLKLEISEMTGKKHLY